MNEKTYKIIGASGIGSLVLGIVGIAAGVAAGTILIINGVKLLRTRKDILI